MINDLNNRINELEEEAEGHKSKIEELQKEKIDLENKKTLIEQSHTSVIFMLLGKFKIFRVMLRSNY